VAAGVTALETLGAFVATAGAPVLRDALALHVADTVGAWIAARRTAEGAALLAWRGTLRAGVAAGTLAALRLEVAISCALARLSEIDDIHIASTTTPGAIVIPAAIAIAAHHPVRDAATLAAAIAAGYEVMVRLGAAVGGATILQRGIWPTYFTAPAAVAAVAARLFGLDARAAADALALALTRAAPGVGHHNAATTTRWLALGQAAEAGLLAALAARAGFTADRGLLDGGFLPGIYDIKPGTTALTARLGEVSVIDEVAFKPWCAARQTMAATQALSEILAAGVAAATITHITAFVPPPHRRMIDHGVTIGDRASFLTSLPYRLAVEALGPAETDVGAPADVPAAIRDFMACVAVEPDDALLADFPRTWPARLEVTHGTGRGVRTVTHIPGDPARPLDVAAIRAKFQRYTAPATGADAAARFFEQAAGLLDHGAGAPAALLAAIENA
jgi:2-methylcitrate dehydratase PrpD